MSLESGPQKIEIAPVNPEDVPGIQEVFYKTWLETYPNEEHGITEDDIEFRYKDRHTSENVEKRKEEIKNLPPNKGYFVAKINNQVIGLCRVEKREDRNQLNAIYVLPQYQGRGLGSKLWEQAHTFIDSSKDTFVEVAEYNANAIEFYKKLGFAETGRHMSDERLKLKSGSTIPEIEMVLKANS